ncbi:hypothetical protein GCM10025880_23240 [Methylorubrum aminovorans]|nr:hypothetical protein GCM10025880_23240 [Methylorubrum aminovorans]
MRGGVCVEIAPGQLRDEIGDHRPVPSHLPLHHRHELRLLVGEVGRNVIGPRLAEFARAALDRFRGGLRKALSLGSTARGLDDVVVAVAHGQKLAQRNQPILEIRLEARVTQVEPETADTCRNQKQQSHERQHEDQAALDRHGQHGGHPKAFLALRPILAPKDAR